jgi:hypothetical protein
MALGSTQPLTEMSTRCICMSVSDIIPQQDVASN